MDKKIIDIKNVVKIYKIGSIKVTALKGNNLDVSSGEFLSIQT